MAISESQKLDFLWKKLGYGFSKTETNSNKLAVNESISSPLLLRGDNIWTQSGNIPSIQPGSSSSLVTVYPTSTPLECTNDGSASQNRTWLTGVTDWISPEFGATFIIKVYIHTSGDSANAASSGTQVLAAGSGNNDEWFFDYQSGILNFNGVNLPSGINFSGKSVYIAGARYNGNIGFNNVEFNSLNVSGIVTATTFSGSLPTTDLTGTIANSQLAGSIPYNKLQNVSTTNRILGRDSAGAGVIEEITPANLLTMIGVESGATADQTAAEIRALVESASDSNVFTDADHTKLNGIESGATADQTKSDIDALNINADKVDGLDIHTGRNDDANKIVRTDANGYIQAGWINSTSGTHSNTVTKVYSTYSGDSYIRYCTPNHLANSMTNVLHSDAADTASQRITFSANDTNNWDTIATGSGSQGGLEIYNSGSGNDAFMTFHVGGDYACYFGLDGGTNKLSVGGWSMGANSYEIYHSGNKPSLATLGYTGATNANYITNNNQLTNGAGYITSYDITTQTDPKYLRSNSDDSASGTITFDGRVNIRGHLDFADSEYAYFGSSDDVEIHYNSNNWFYMNNKGNGIIFQDNGSNVMRLEDSGIFRPESDGNGRIGSSSVRWGDGYFDDMSITNTLSVRGAVDLADNDVLRFGNSDDVEFFCNGSHMYMDLNSGIGNFYIRDGTTTRYTFDDNGDFTATGNVTAYSDIKLKKNIEIIPNALNKVCELRGVIYDRIDLEGEENQRQSGVVAQEVEKVLPEVVSTNEEGIKSVSYGNMVGLLIEAIKEQQQQIDELKRKLEEK